MNAFKISSLLAFGVALSLVSTGCKHKPPPVTHFGNPNGGLTGNSGDIGSAGTLGLGTGLTGGPAPMGGGDLATFDPDQMAQDRTAFAADTIYFAYDSSSIRSGDEAKLTAVASALKSDPSAKLLIEGNCDERGTEEYNRSLGERRALAAREALANQGVEPARVATRSYGEDRPADPGHSESAWSMNRRDEFVLLHPR
jgi:peptidoglycan-associated lipoprotein